MFETAFQFLFGYPPVAYARGKLSLLAPWPRWLLLAAIVAGLLLLAWQLRRRMGPLTRSTAAVWGLQAAMLALLLLLLWRPALVVSAVVPRQNIAAILLDDSASMSLEAPARIDKVKEAFGPQSAVIAGLQDRFQVRLYRFSSGASRLQNTEPIAATGALTRLEDAVGEVLNETEGLPLGAVILVTDGADNASSRERSVLAELKSRRVPLHTVGVGRERFDRDLQVNDVVVSSTIPAGGIASASVSLRQEGYAGKTVNLEVRENGTLIQSRAVQFDHPAQSMSVRVNFTPRSQGVKEYTFALPVESDEAIRQNNTQARVIVVDDRKAKVLYAEGEPRWEYKFIRRAVVDDPSLQLVTLLRTSANKFYRQGVESEKVLETGFPKPEELFTFDGLVLGSLEAGFFGSEETQSVYDFVSRRGGGLLALGGRRSLADGGYQNTMLADLLPVSLPASGPTFFRREARAELTNYGLDAPMLQLAVDPQKSAARWKALPPLGDYQRTGEPKPGAVVLARAAAQGERAPVPLLVSQRFGRGRTLLFATASSWRWQMELDHRDDSHELFWRQLLRWLVSETPGPVRVTTDKPLYRDERRVEIRAEVRDRGFRPVEDATVMATITAPDGSRHELPLDWSARDEGVFTGRWEASGAGTFSVEVNASRGAAPEGMVGRAVTYFRRTEGTLEFYNAQQNRALLSRLAEETGGRYYPLEKVSELPRDIVYSEGGVTEQNVYDLWHLPAVILLLLILKGTEWGLRKAKGSV